VTDNKPTLEDIGDFLSAYATPEGRIYTTLAGLSSDLYDWIQSDFEDWNW
jgi:hypothetical protein